MQRSHAPPAGNFLDTAHVFGCHHNQTSDIVEDVNNGPLTGVPQSSSMTLQWVSKDAWRPHVLRAKLVSIADLGTSISSRSLFITVCTRTSA